MKVSFHFKMFISLRVFVASITLMQVCLVLRISDDGNLNLQLIGHIRERVISKCGASWQRMRGLASSLTGTPPSRSSVDWNIQRWKMLRLVCILNLGELPPPQGAWNSWEMILFVTNDWIGVLLLWSGPRIPQCHDYRRIDLQWWLVLPKISTPLLGITG